VGGAIAGGAGPRAAQYRRLVKRRGDTKAIVAVAHSIVIVYHVLRDGRSYRELEGDYFDRLSIDRLTRYTRRHAALGYAVTLRKSAA
jgi:transposase